MSAATRAPAALGGAGRLVAPATANGVDPENDESPAAAGFRRMGAAGFEPATSRV